jgi:alanine racemase
MAGIFQASVLHGAPKNGSIFPHPGLMGKPGQSITAMLAAQGAEVGPLLVSSPSDIHGSVVSDTVVERNCSLHVRGNVLGNLTIERGANVVVDGSVDGRIVNRGGTLVVHNKGLAACVMLAGPPEAEASGVLKINLTELAGNWENLSRRTPAECAAVVKADAYGCGIGPIAGALAKTGCRTFFVSDLPEAKSVRAVAPNAVIYVLNGLYAGTGAAFAEANARPVINSPIQMAEWDAFVAAQQWAGGYALNVDTGESRRGLTIDEAAGFAPRINWPDHGIELVMSSLDHPDRPDHPSIDRQLAAFRELRRLYQGVPASLANSAGIALGAKVHFDMVRAGSALYGVNPAPGAANAMRPVLELQARIVQIRNLDQGQAIGNGSGMTVKRRSRLAWVSVGYADGYPAPPSPLDGKLHVMVGAQRCPVAAPPTMDLLPVDVTDADPAAARLGAMVTLIGPELGITELAAAARITGRHVLARLGQRFHRIYYAI